MYLHENNHILLGTHHAHNLIMRFLLRVLSVHAHYHVSDLEKKNTKLSNSGRVDSESATESLDSVRFPVESNQRL